MKFIILILLLVSNVAVAKSPLQDSFTISSMNFEEPWEHYKAAIFADGTTVLILQNEDAAVKSFQIHNSPSTFQDLISTLDEFQFTRFEDDYGWMNDEEKDPKCTELLSGHVYTHASLQYAGQEKIVSYYHGCQGFFRETELKSLLRHVKDIMGLSEFVGT
ncbi:hypothetical protein [Aliidiomarina maris]|uniref:Uncharacterized protein n=1 Tax=Aliidiomarina maris TaxID=531312 RepID=A0A327WNY9_9GAMM|nr:hypothetical protein [Aliidiomarina maris]RAJ93315.1 hypothetical protein B0I24_12042 [Aliidiomarina maris]RUO18569.1 hypothetical protein CWE07_13810 [Aliidiomarina maris]